MNVSPRLFIMKIIVGLGNPGREYDGTRHNIGFAAVDDLLSLKASSLGTRPTNERPLVLAPMWKDKFRALCVEGSYTDGSVSPTAELRIILMKPQTFMNLSGEAVGEAAHFYKCALEDVVVLHDDIDLPLGELRLRQGGGDGGHNGLKSLTACLGSAKYYRVRIGVGRPGGAATPTPGAGELSQFHSASKVTTERSSITPQTGSMRQEVSSWVLSTFPKGERQLAEATSQRAGMASLKILAEGLAVAQRQFNGLLKEPSKDKRS